MNQERKEFDDETWKKAERLVQLISKGAGIDKEELNIEDGKEILVLCPTCFRTRKGFVKNELYEKLNGTETCILNQCDYCRDLNREVDLKHMKAVLTGKIVPLPKLDETTSFSDLIHELLERLDEN